MHFHEDDRAQRFCNIFPVQGAQIMASRIRSPGHIVAWHLHHEKTDWWCCLQGSFKVGLVDMLCGDGNEVQWEYLSDHNPQTLVIPPYTAHGYTALEPNSIMLYYMDKEYDESDELRLPVGHFNEEWQIPNK